MKCHYCDSDADLDVEHEGVIVWMCQDHFKEQFDELAESDSGIPF